MRRNQMMPIAQHFNLAAERPSTYLTRQWHLNVSIIAGSLEKSGQCRKYFGRHDLQRCCEMHGLNSPAQLGQPQHHRHIPRRLHPLFPRRHRRGKRVSCHKHLPSFVEGGSAFMSPGGQFVVSPDIDLEPDVTLTVADDFAPSRIGAAEDLGDVPRARLDLFQESLHAEPG
jgi:hypothetical protein